MLCGRSTWMHSGILRSALYTPFQVVVSASFQRNSLTGGFANGMPSQALTPESSTRPSTVPPSVWTSVGGGGASRLQLLMPTATRYGYAQIRQSCHGEPHWSSCARTSYDAQIDDGVRG